MYGIADFYVFKLASVITESSVSKLRRQVSCSCVINQLLGLAQRRQYLVKGNVTSELYNTLTKQLQCVKTEMSLTTCPAKWPKATKEACKKGKQRLPVTFLSLNGFPW